MERHNKLSRFPTDGLGALVFLFWPREMGRWARKVKENGPSDVSDCRPSGNPVTKFKARDELGENGTYVVQCWPKLTCFV